MKIVKELFNECKSRSLHVSLTQQRITDISVEIYKGFNTNYEKVYFIDSCSTIKEAASKALHFLKGYNTPEKSFTTTSFLGEVVSYIGFGIGKHDMYINPSDIYFIENYTPESIEQFDKVKVKVKLQNPDSTIHELFELPVKDLFDIVKNTNNRYEVDLTHTNKFPEVFFREINKRGIKIKAALSLGDKYLTSPIKSKLAEFTEDWENNKVLHIIKDMSDYNWIIEKGYTICTNVYYLEYEDTLIHER